MGVCQIDDGGKVRGDVGDVDAVHMRELSAEAFKQVQRFGEAVHPVAEQARGCPGAEEFFGNFHGSFAEVLGGKGRSGDGAFCTKGNVVKHDISNSDMLAICFFCPKKAHIY